MKSLLTLALAALLSLPLHAQNIPTQLPPPPPAPATPSSVGDWLSSGLAALNASTNTIYEAHAIYAPALSKRFGGGVGVAFPLSDMVFTHLRLDDVGGSFYAVSANVGVQKTIAVWKLHLTPEVHAGVAIPMAGARLGTFTIPGSVTDGQPQAITGAGLLVRLATGSDWFVDAFGSVEVWSPLSTQAIYLFGVAGHFTF